MPIPPAIRLPIALFAGLLCLAGCGTSSETAPVSNTPNYGANKVPPPEKVKAVPGKGARSTGAPPQVH